MARILKEDAGRLMANVPEEYVFRCHDGGILRSIQELGEAIGSMTDETYTFHANTDNNDFSNWVRDIIHDDKLARDLAKSQSRFQATNMVTKRVAFLQNRLV